MSDVKEITIINEYEFNNIKSDISNILKSITFCTSHSLQTYEDISNGTIKKIKKNFSEDINVDGIVAIIDESFFNNYKRGMVFTITGVYFNQDFLKRQYFNYADISSIGSNTYTEVHLNNGFVVEVSDVGYIKDNLIEVFLRLKRYALEKGLVSKRESSILKKQEMPKELSDKCHAIIHSSAAAAGVAGAGLAQIPLSDTAIITPIQIGMITGLGLVFEMEITDAAAQAIISSAGAALIGRGAAQVLVGWIPGIGNAINVATASGLTEAIGWIAANQFYQQSFDNIIQAEKNGYNNASELYEKKLHDQATEFLKQKKVSEEEKKKLNQLIDEYEKLIDEYERKLDENYNNKISVMKTEWGKLKRLQRIS